MCLNAPSLLRRSQLLTPGMLEVLTAGAKALEQDKRGVKVYRLASGDILKIFRLRSRFSSARLYSYARRFCRNAARLQALGIPTVAVRQLFHLQGSSATAVLYQPLAGHTLRDLAYGDGIPAPLFDTLGVFIARLHAVGVHFRSLHLGNIVLTPHGELGLIDISDLSVYRWALHCPTRLRSIRHFYRYPAENKQLGEGGSQRLWLSYFQHSHLSAACEVQLRLGIARLEQGLWG